MISVDMATENTRNFYMKVSGREETVFSSIYRPAARGQQLQALPYPDRTCDAM